MNCKPGDLAVVVRSSREGDTSIIGRIVTCVRLVEHQGWSCWLLNRPLDGVAGHEYDTPLYALKEPSSALLPQRGKQ